MKAIILVTSFQFLFAMSVISQIHKTEYNNIEGDYLILTEDYAEYRFGSIFGGGEIERGNDNNSFEIINDFGYMNQTKSYVLKNVINHNENPGILQFQLLNESLTPVPLVDYIIYSRKNNKSSICAKSVKSDGTAELYLQRLPIDSMVYIEASNYYPLKIRIDNLVSKTYTIVLAKSNGNLLYAKDENSKIVCEHIDRDSLRCQISQRWSKRKTKHFESILYKRSD